MKIAIFTDIYAPWSYGGIASSVKTQKDDLERLGHEVWVFCPGFQAHERHVVTVPSYEDLRINGAVIAKSPEKVEAFVLKKFPDFGSFDIVCVHYELCCSIAGMKLARKFDIPLVQTMHGREDMAIAVNVPHPFKFVVAATLNNLHKKYLPHETVVKKDKFQAKTCARAKMWTMMVNHANFADVVITPSRHFAQKLEHYGVTKPIEVVSNGIADDVIETEFEERELADGAVLKMIWNSRMSKEKRILPFLKALTELKRPYILYAYSDGNELKRAQKFAKKHGIKVKFFGRQKREKILEQMRKCHLGIMASYNFDTQGMTLLEAEATGLPVFFCDPEMMEVVPRESFVIAGGPEAEAMALALDNLESKQIKKMSQQMLKKRAEVAQSVQTKKLLKIYEKLLKK